MFNWREKALLNTSEEYENNWEKIFKKNADSTTKSNTKKLCELSPMADSDVSCGGIPEATGGKVND